MSQSPPNIKLKEAFGLDIFKERLKKREIWINGVIDEFLVEKLYIHLIKLQEESQQLPIMVIVNSLGGNFYEAVVGTDIMGTIKPFVRTVAMANAVSGGFILFMGGQERVCYDYTNLMMHSAGFGIMDKVPDIEARVKYIKSVQEKMARFFSYQTGGKTTPGYWVKLFESGKDKWFPVEEAVRLGIVHKVIKRKEMIDPNFQNRLSYTWDIRDIMRSQQ